MQKIGFILAYHKDFMDTEVFLENVKVNCAYVIAISALNRATCFDKSHMTLNCQARFSF